MPSPDCLSEVWLRVPSIRAVSIASSNYKNSNVAISESVASRLLPRTVNKLELPEPLPLEDGGGFIKRDILDLAYRYGGGQPGLDGIARNKLRHKKELAEQGRATYRRIFETALAHWDPDFPADMDCVDLDTITTPQVGLDMAMMVRSSIPSFRSDLD